MKFQTTKKLLVKALSHCAKVADKRSTLPILENVLIYAVGEKVFLKATDMVIGVSFTVEAEVAEPGSIALPADNLAKRIAAMPEGLVEISAGSDSQATIRSVNAPRRYVVSGIPGAEFPLTPTPEGLTEDEVQTAVLTRLIACTHYSISHDQTRIHLASALFETKDGIIRMVSTDGHRLSVIEEEAKVSNRESMLVPGAGVQELRRICDEAKDSSGSPAVKISRNASHLFLRSEGLLVSVKLADATFPPYRQVIPESLPTTTVFKRTEAIDSVKAVLLAASDKTGGIKLIGADGKLHFQTSDPDAGSAEDEFEAVTMKGPNFVVGLNGKYVLDVLSSVTDDEMTLRTGGELEPVLLSPGTGKAQFLGVVMPMRI